MPILPTLLYRFNSIIKISATFFVDIYKIILKYIQKNKETTVAKTNLKKSKVGGIVDAGQLGIIGKNKKKNLHLINTTYTKLNQDESQI